MNPYKNWRPNRKDRYNLKSDYLTTKAEGKQIMCMGCGKVFRPPDYEGMHLHHILPVEKFPQRFWDIDNVVPLCKRCHNKVHWALFAYRKLAHK